MGLLLLTSCVREKSSSVAQDRIYTEYELFYDANEDKTYARATFRFSNLTGTKLELDQPATVSFNGDELTWNNALAYYEREYAGLVGSGTFSYTDLEDNTFVNSISMKPIGLQNDLDSISRAAAFNLVWTGDLLGANENVTVAVNNANAVNPQLFYQDDLGSQSVVLEQNKLNVLLAGPAFVVIDRRFVPALQQKTSAGGLLTGRYRGKNKNTVLFN